VKVFLGRVTRKLISFFQLELNFLYDYFRFKKYFSPENRPKINRKKLEALILKDSHRIEKALCLPNTRFYFGEEALNKLISNLIKYLDKYGKDNVYYFGIGSLNAYEEFHVAANKKLPTFFINLKKNIGTNDLQNKICKDVGIESVQSFDTDYSSFFYQFVSSRHSCRDFETTKLISKEIVKNIMESAIRAPSVCNRQHWHVHFYTGEKKAEILKMQNGNTGFSENIPYLALVTSDLRSFYTKHERQQPFVDGGLFSMSLMYAMHSHGICSCPLNWCNSFITDRNLHKLQYIGDSESVIMLIAFGYPNLDGHYAKSPRMPVDSFYSLNNFD
jgi:nitroreductase